MEGNCKGLRATEPFFKTFFRVVFFGETDVRGFFFFIDTLLLFRLEYLRCFGDDSIEELRKRFGQTFLLERRLPADCITGSSKLVLFSRASSSRTVSQSVSSFSVLVLRTLSSISVSSPSSTFESWEVFSLCVSCSLRLAETGSITVFFLEDLRKLSVKFCICWDMISGLRDVLIERRKLLFKTLTIALELSKWFGDFSFDDEVENIDSNSIRETRARFLRSDFSVTFCWLVKFWKSLSFSKRVLNGGIKGGRSKSVSWSLVCSLFPRSIRSEYVLWFFFILMCFSGENMMKFKNLHYPTIANTTWRKSYKLENINKAQWSTLSAHGLCHYFHLTKTLVSHH